MIAYLQGKVLAVNAESVIIVTNGVGYEVFCSGAAFATVQQYPENVELFTYLQVKEDGVTLYGFASLKEKQLFMDLISVSGVGPKMGVTILNGLSADDVARCIATADTKTLSRVKGLGKKTAEKIVLELHGKISASELLEADGERETAVPTKKVAPMSVMDEDSVAALMNLGFTRSESQNAVQKAKERGAKSVEDVIRVALSMM